MKLLQYVKDSRSIPISGDSSDIAEIGTKALFSVVDGELLVQDPDSGCGPVKMADHMQYTLNQHV